MDVSLWAALIGIFSGAAGYWFSTFSVQPVLKYRDARSKVLVNFVYYAQVVDAEGLNEEMVKLHRERVLSNRKTSGELNAAVAELPSWYLSWLEFRGLNPIAAARSLIGYSNTTEYDRSAQLEESIRKNLGLLPGT